MSDKPIPDEVQQIQTAYRRRILDCWNIPPGSRVLEIGCGQGDMTAVLAEAVGPTGRIVATDIASRNYGSPLTLGEATDLIKASELGDRIEFHFETDITNPQTDFEQFDFAVMAHCSWYFDSAEQLKQTLTAVSKKAKNLCFVEWNTVPNSMEQIPHLLAVNIQGFLEAFKPESRANVRSPFTATQLQQIIAESGWKITNTASPSTEGLQDADWEIGECLSRVGRELDDPTMTPIRRHLLEGQMDTLRQIAKPTGNTPLSSIAFRGLTDGELWR